MQTLLLLAVGAAALAAATVAVQRAVPGLTDPVWLRARVRGFGVFGPLAFVGLQATQVVVAPVPGQVLAFAGGYLFGTVHGAAYSLLGAALGSTVAFLLARRFGRPYVERVVTAETLDAFDDVVDRDGAFALFLVFLVPGLPDDVVCFVAGVTRIPVWKLVAVSVVGRVPGFLLVSHAGAELAAANYALVTALLGALAAVAALVYWQRADLLAALRDR